MSVLIASVKTGKGLVKTVKNSARWDCLHKILKVNQNDTNLLCDKFFRQNELFDKSKDKVRAGYKIYSIDDIAPSYQTQMDNDINFLFAKNNLYIGSKAEKVKLLKDNKTFYPEIFDTVKSEKLWSYLDKGYLINDVLNILYSSIINGTIRNEIADAAFKLLDKGYPIEMVVKYIEKSKISRFNGMKKYTRGTLEFIEKFPHLKHTVVSKNSFGEEIFDSHGAKLFPILYDCAPNEITAIRVFKDCKVKDVDGSLITLDYLFDKAYEILKTKGKYTINDARVLSEMRKNPVPDDIYRVHKLLFSQG